jgi:hypothetical protein
VDALEFINLTENVEDILKTTPPSKPVLYSGCHYGFGIVDVRFAARLYSFSEKPTAKRDNVEGWDLCKVIRNEWDGSKYNRSGGR